MNESKPLAADLLTSLLRLTLDNLNDAHRDATEPQDRAEIACAYEHTRQHLEALEARK